MADPVARPTLLPPFAVPRERAIGGANAAVAEIDHAVVRQAGGPDIGAVPASYLPARAEMASVDVWDPLWPEAVKRAAIAAAPEVHRHKGTVRAVKAALGALRIDADVVEWWQESPRGAPYTFTVRAFARARLYDGPLLDARLIAVAYASVLRAKPVSRAFDLIVGVVLPAHGGLAPVLTGKAVTARALVPRPRADFAAGLGLAPVLVGAVRVSRAMVPVLPPPA